MGPFSFSLSSMDLMKKAEDQFGKDRAEELRPEIEQLASELEKLRSVSLQIDDEP